jgi:uncharacterized protein YdaU (DUF1376 family)
MSESRNGLFVEYCAKDFLDGTNNLDVWEELAYRRIVDMIYNTNDKLLDDRKKLAWQTKTGSRWPKIREVLIEAGKIEVLDGRITNARCRKELEKTAKKIAQKRVAGQASFVAKKATGNPLKNNETTPTAVGVAVATADPTAAQLTSNPINQEEEKKEVRKGEGCVSSNSVVLFPVAASPSAPPPSTPATSKGTRLPQGWTLPQEWGEWAMQNGNLSAGQVRREADIFHDHWVAKPGVAGRKEDWFATWRNWVRKAPTFNHGGNTNGRHHQSQRQPERNGFAVINRAFEERDGRSFDFGDTGNSGW